MTDPNNTKRKVLRMRGLRQRWLMNTVLPIFLLLTTLVALCSTGVSNYFYSSMQKGLETRAQVLTNSFNEYFMSSGYNSYYK